MRSSPIDSSVMTASPGEDLKSYLDRLADHFDKPAFVDADPVSVPHAFDDPADQEIIALYAALLAWGRRSTVLSKMDELCRLMDYKPARFVHDFAQGGSSDRLAGFRHRTFQPVDAYWFTRNLSLLLAKFGSVERIFSAGGDGARSVEAAIERFSNRMMTASPDTPARLRKHLARPSARSACKRLVMYLRWMVRPGPVDIGIWNSFLPCDLILPVDLHSGRQARALGLLTRNANDWAAALELTKKCGRLQPDDPCRYDLVFFGVGAYELTWDDRFVLSPSIDR